jgi:hypothetical protein
MVLKPMAVTNLNTRHLPEVGWTASDPDIPNPPLRTISQQKAIASFDHLVGAGEQRRRHSKAERLGGPEVDDQRAGHYAVDPRSSLLVRMCRQCSSERL